MTVYKGKGLVCKKIKKSQGAFCESFKTPANGHHYVSLRKSAPCHLLCAPLLAGIRPTRRAHRALPPHTHLNLSLALCHGQIRNPSSWPPPSCRHLRPRQLTPGPPLDSSSTPLPPVIGIGQRRPEVVAPSASSLRPAEERRRRFTAVGSRLASPTISPCSW